MMSPVKLDKFQWVYTIFWYQYIVVIYPVTRKIYSSAVWSEKNRIKVDGFISTGTVDWKSGKTWHRRIKSMTMEAVASMKNPKVAMIYNFPGINLWRKKCMLKLKSTKKMPAQCCWLKYDPDNMSKTHRITTIRSDRSKINITFWYSQEIINFTNRNWYNKCLIQWLLQIRKSCCKA